MEGNNSGGEIQNAADTEKEDQKVEKDMDGCSICLTAPQNSVSLNCYHICCCYSCTKKLWEEDGCCPLCRKERASVQVSDLFVAIKMDQC